jgi:hypothetical protein
MCTEQPSNLPLSVLLLLLLLHPSLLLLLPYPLTCASTIIWSATAPADCHGPTLPIHIGNSIIILIILSVMYGFFLPGQCQYNGCTSQVTDYRKQFWYVFFTLTVDGFDVAIHIALALLKLEDCASNMVTRSQLAASTDELIIVLRMDFAKDTEPTIVAI